MKNLAKVGLVIWVIFILVGSYNSRYDKPELVAYQEEITRQEKYGEHQETYYQQMGNYYYPVSYTVDDYRTVGTGQWVTKQRVDHTYLIWSPIVGFFCGGTVFFGLILITKLALFILSNT